MNVPNLDEIVGAYLEIEQTQGDRMTNADMAADIVDNLSAQGTLGVDPDDEVAVNLAIKEIEDQLPYYTGRSR